MLPLVVAASVGWGYQAPPPPLFITGYQRQAPATQMVIVGKVSGNETAMFTIQPRRV